MNAAVMALTLALGALIGALYFGGLWWTLARLGRWRRPALALSVSFLARALPALAVFVLLARLGPMPLALALVGFLVMRLALSAWIRPTPPSSGARVAEGGRPGDGPVGGVA